MLMHTASDAYFEISTVPNIVCVVKRDFLRDEQQEHQKIRNIQMLLQQFKRGADRRIRRRQSFNKQLIKRVKI